MSLPKSCLALVICLKTNIYLFILWITQKKGFVPDATLIANFKLVNLVRNESSFNFAISTCKLDFINKCIFLSYSLSDLGTHSPVYFFQLIRDVRGLWSLPLHFGKQRAQQKIALVIL